jgi:hypothetical protein
VTLQTLLSQVVSDFNVLYRAYARAGLLAEETHTETAQKLLGSGDDVYRFKRAFLLAEALIRNRVGRLVYGSGGLRHLAVFGGNNVGKSTVVNILAAEQVASTSLEGGHTRHAQAFCGDAVHEGGRRLFGDNPYAFYRFTPATVGALDRQRFEQYGRGRRSTDVLPPDMVLWDMPDCDATESHKYMYAMVEAVTVADVLVYVTSVERYAVAHLIEWIFLLHDAGIDFVECLNKTRHRDQRTVIENQRMTHFPEMARQLGMPAPTPPVVGLRYLVEGEERRSLGPTTPRPCSCVTRPWISSRGPTIDKPTPRHSVSSSSVSTGSWSQARMEVLAKGQWAARSRAAVQDFVTLYEQAYLQSDQVIEPLSRLNLRSLPCWTHISQGSIRRYRCSAG